jgi:hypothetical protein
MHILSLLLLYIEVYLEGLSFAVFHVVYVSSRMFLRKRSCYLMGAWYVWDVEIHVRVFGGVRVKFFLSANWSPSNPFFQQLPFLYPLFFIIHTFLLSMVSVLCVFLWCLMKWLSCFCTIVILVKDFFWYSWCASTVPYGEYFITTGCAITVAFERIVLAGIVQCTGTTQVLAAQFAITCLTLRYSQCSTSVLPAVRLL